MRAINGIKFKSGLRVSLWHISFIYEFDLLAIPFYGSPLSPEQAAQVTTPILGLYGADDGGISPDAVKAMQDALTAAGVDNSFTIYPGAPHAFFNDTRESYRPEAAADAWQQALAWLQKYLS